MEQDILKNSAGDTDEALKAIKTVRDRVLSKFDATDPGIVASGYDVDNMPVKGVNDIKRQVGAEINKFSAPDMLNSSQKMEQEAYRQVYFKLRDLVDTAEPDTKELNGQISADIDLQDLLQK